MNTWDLKQFKDTETQKKKVMDLQHIGTSLLIECRRIARENKNFATSDLIRDELDRRLDFVFDTKEGQEVYSFPPSFFANMDKIASLNNIAFNSKRHFVEWKLNDEKRINNLVDAWIYTNTKTTTS